MSLTKKRTVGGRTRAAYERYLNRLYADSYGFEEVVEQFGHWFKDDRAARRGLRVQYHNHTLGTLQRKKDPVAFNTGYNDWKR